MEKLRTQERIELLRKERIKSSETEVLKLLRSLHNNEITLNDDSIWDSFRNSIINDSVLLEKSIEVYIEEILSEYDEGRSCAKTVILGLAKDPLRQNISEEVQEEIAIEKGFRTDKLPQSGKYALRVFQGKIVKSYELTKKEKELASKALDFEYFNLTKPQFTYYTYNKYNKWVGGSTDDVFNDIRHLIENFMNIKEKSIILMIILDGDYWDLNRHKLQLYQNENLIITSSDELSL